MEVTVCSLHTHTQSLQSAKEIHQFHHDVDELKGWIAEKEAVLDTEEDQDLHSIQTLMKQHEALEVIQILYNQYQHQVSVMITVIVLEVGLDF